MARHSSGLAFKRMRFELPAKTMTSLSAGGQSLRRLEQLDRSGREELAAIDSHSEPHEVRRRGQERGGARIAGIIPNARRLRPVSRVPGESEFHEVERRARWHYVRRDVNRRVTHT